MEKWTPGPWKWYNDNDLSQYRSPYNDILESGCRGEYGACGGFIEWGPNKEANKAIIAAAPELYEALKRITEYGDIYNYRVNDIYRYRTNERTPYEQAMEAIKKAEGGDPDATS